MASQLHAMPSRTIPTFWPYPYAAGGQWKPQRVGGVTTAGYRVHNGASLFLQEMNGLLAAMAVANPVITALLAVIVFLEKDKLKKRSEDLEAALQNGSSSVVRTIEAQKQDFTNIANRLELLSKDSEKSAATFIGLSTALTESSAVSAKALGGVTEGLQDHGKSLAILVTNLSTKVSDTSATAITELGNKATQAVGAVAEQVARVEAALVANKEASIQAIAELATRNAEALKSVSDEIKKIEAAQVASKEASTQAIAELATKMAELLKQIGEGIKRVEAAQTESAKSAADSVAKLAQEVGQTSKSIKELQETLKSTVTL